MKDWKVEVEFSADTESFDNDLKSSVHKTAEDISRELGRATNDVDTSGFTSKLKQAVGGLKGEQIEVFLDTIQAETQFKDLKTLSNMTMSEMQNEFNNVSAQALQSALSTLQEGLTILTAQSENLKGSLGGLNNVDTMVANARITELGNESDSTKAKIEMLSDKLSQIGASSKPVEEATSRMKSLSHYAKDVGDKAVKGALGGVSSFKRFAFGLLGVQSAYALLSKSMRNYIEANPQIKAQVEGITSALGTLLAPALRVIIQGFQVFVRWVMIAIAYVSTFINVIFGTNIAVRLTIDAVTKASSGMGKLGKSAKKAGKAVSNAFKGAIGSFDDLNVLTSETDDNMSDMGSGLGGDMGGLSVTPPDMSAFDISEYIAPLKQFASWLEKNKTLIKAITILVLGVIAVFLTLALVTKIITGIGIAIQIVGLIFQALPIVLIILAIIATLYLLYAYWDEITAFLGAVWAVVWEGIKLVALAIMEVLKIAWNVFIGAIMLLIDVLVLAWDVAWAVIGTVLKVVLAVLGGLWKGFVALLELVIKGFVVLWEVIWNSVFAIINFVIGLISGAWKLLWSGIKIAFEVAVAIIKVGAQALGDFFSFIWNGIKTVFQTVANIIGTVWNSTVAGIKSVFTGVWNFLTSAVNNIGKVFAGVWNGIKTAFSNAFNGIKSIFTNVWNWILGQFSKGGTIFSGVVDGVAGVFKTIVNTLINGINTIIALPFKAINGTLNGIRNVKVLGVKPFSGLWSQNPIPVPQVPRLKDGGFAEARRGGTHVLVGEGIYDEAITPTGGPRFREMTSNIAKDVVDFTGGGTGGNDTNVDIYVQFEEQTLGRASIKAINAVQRTAGKVLVKV